jgi:hypothetical protein
VREKEERRQELTAPCGLLSKSNFGDVQFSPIFRTSVWLYKLQCVLDRHMVIFAYWVAQSTISTLEASSPPSR